jgi:hypothetical protein
MYTIRFLTHFSLIIKGLTGYFISALSIHSPRGNNKSGRYQGAIRTCKLAIRLKPDDAEAHFGLEINLNRVES